MAHGMEYPALFGQVGSACLAVSLHTETNPGQHVIYPTEQKPFCLHIILIFVIVLVYEMYQ